MRRSSVTSKRVRFPHAVQRYRVAVGSVTTVRLPGAPEYRILAPTNARSVEHTFVVRGQRSFDDLGTPLSDVTFCVLDLETTGGDPATCAITEIGAVAVRGGERLGTFRTFVNPGRAIPPTITVLTGITESMVARAPRIEEVLASLLAFVGDAVIVGHNVRFDLAFLQAALDRGGRDRLDNPTVDTVALARRLLRDEVPDCKLGTLASRFRFPNQPSHRALDDALATADLLHLLLDRAGSLGVTGLDDLRSLPTMAGHAQAAKLRLTERLPRSPGVYLFRAADGRVLYVGKATNLRARVRSYFSTEERRKVGAMLAETERIDHKRTATVLEAAVLEMRLIHHLEPRYNVEGRRWHRSVWVKLTAERFPRLTVVRQPKDDGATYLGPLTSRRSADLVVEAVHTVVPLRRCTTRAGRHGPCVPAQLGVSLCTCTGEVTAERYAPVAELARTGLTLRPELLVGPLTERMGRLAAEERYEEAAATRDRILALTAALRRQRQLDRVRSAAVLVVADRVGNRYEFRRGRLTRFWDAPAAGEATIALDGIDPGREVEAVPDDPGPPSAGPLRSDLSDELLICARWLDRHAAQLRVDRVVGAFAEPTGALPRLEAGGRGPVSPRR